MNNILKKSLVIISVLFFLVLTIGSTYAMNINNNTTILEELQQKTMTIYRVSPNGNITPIKVNITEEIENIEKYLESKCSELFENDLEMQTLIPKLKSQEIKDYNRSFDFGLIRIKSHGRGFHIKTKLDFNLNNKFLLISIIFATFLPSIKKSLVIGFYKDENANTTYYPIVRSKFNQESIKYLNGNHTIIAEKFYGYTTWIGRFSCITSQIFFQKELIPHAFSGVCRSVIYYKTE